MYMHLTEIVNYMTRHLRTIRQSHPRRHCHRPQSYWPLDDLAKTLNVPVFYLPLPRFISSSPPEDDDPDPVWTSLCPPEKTCPPENLGLDLVRCLGYDHLLCQNYWIEPLVEDSHRFRRMA